jgi:hypothetical protein
MTVKLLVLKSGEDVIADVKDLSVEDRTVGYLLINPYIVKIKTADIVFDENNNNVAVTFYPYVPLSDQKEIPIPSDWVVTIVEPVSQVKDLYEKRGNQKHKTSSSSEQHNSDNSDTGS